MLYPKLKANRIIHTFLRLSRKLKVFLLLSALTFDLSPCLVARRGGVCPPDKVCNAYLKARKGGKGDKEI